MLVLQMPRYVVELQLQERAKCEAEAEDGQALIETTDCSRFFPRPLIHDEGIANWWHRRRNWRRSGPLRRRK